MKNVLVNAMALRQVLVALNGAPHLIRELQVLRRSSTPGVGSISDLTGQVNPIDQLLEEFNDQVTRGDIVSDLLQREQVTYQVRIQAGDESNWYFDKKTDSIGADDVPRLTEHQLGVISGMHEAMQMSQVIYLCRQKDSRFFDVRLCLANTRVEGAVFEIYKYQKLHVVESVESKKETTSDLDLWKKFLEYFNMPFKHERRELNQERLDKDPGRIYYTAGDTLTLETKSNEIVDGYNGFHVDIYFDDDGKLVQVYILE